MGRIIIIDNGRPGSDDSWIGWVILAVLFFGGIGMWSYILETYRTSESEEERKFVLLFAVTLILSCVVTTSVYVLICGKYLDFFESFIVICFFTTVVAGIILWLVTGTKESEKETGGLIIFGCSLFGAGIPSAIAAVICRLLRYK